MSAVSEQLITVTDSTSAIECPICMEPIEALYNRVVTECGHAFHCACLMQNAAHNGFGCPYCRTKMAEKPREHEDEDEDEDEGESIFNEDALTSFRMFHQQLNGEQIEEEPDDDWESFDGSYEVEDEQYPDSAYVSQKLIEQGITFEDLVKNILYQEHNNYVENDYYDYYDYYERRSLEIYGKFRAIISQYTPQTVTQTVTEAEPAVPHVELPLIAEPKSVTISSIVQVYGRPVGSNEVMYI